MELTPNVVLIFAVVVVVTFVLIRWARRHEAAPPVDAPATRARSSNTMAARDDRGNDPLVNWLLDRASEQTGINVAQDPLARKRIEEAAVQAMDDLRTGGSASINLPFLTADARGPRHFAVQFKRNPDSTFELQR